MAVDVTSSPKPVHPILLPKYAPLTLEQEKQSRLDVVAYARSWIRTPYIQQADMLGAGIDCSMLLVRVFVDTGLIADVDPRPYPPTWFLHQSEERYLAWMQQVACEIEESEIQGGDIGLYKFGQCFAHTGIITPERTLISASAYHHQCIESELTSPWIANLGRGKVAKKRPVKYFNIYAKLRELGASCG